LDFLYFFIGKFDYSIVWMLRVLSLYREKLDFTVNFAQIRNDEFLAFKPEHLVFWICSSGSRYCR